MTKLIPLTQGQSATVDDEDYHFLMQWKWCLRKIKSGLLYASRTQQGISMHRVIMGNIPARMEVDHIDGDGLNNQRSNLRIVTHDQNMRNRKKQLGTSSQYKGVSWNCQSNKWQASIKPSKAHKLKNLGHFLSEEAAARAYDAAAREHFGEFARLNFPD